eukprot:GFKZ01004154.1.p1 GENE.GFKZ01004154.1~~GFKZ01004154.1.p1  ORF type:complete len:884 (-),score=134.07 GFKZ01004154.1:2238-4889(-)
MDMRWVSDTHLCSLGLSCVLRLRDIRDPVATLEQNSEGLSGSFSMDALEPNVAVLGANSGYLRVIRLFGADGVMVRMPVKRVNLQTGPFRDMKSIPVASNGSKVASQTLLYAGGSEGLLHECKFPRPIWTSMEACNIAKTEHSEKFRWLLRKAAKLDNQKCDRASNTLVLQLGKEFGTLGAHAIGDPGDDGTAGFKPSLTGAKRGDAEGSTEGGQHNGTSDHGEDLDGQQNGDMPEPTGSRIATKSKPKLIDKNARDMVYSHFGENYDQKIVISKIGVSAKSDMIAIGIAGGTVTWLRLDLSGHESLAREHELHEDRRKKPGKVQHVKAIPKEDIPPRKRGRPRKMAGTIGKAVSIRPPEAKPLELPKPAPVPAKEKAKRRYKEKREQKLEKEKEKEIEKETETSKKSLPIYGPKRKRGRPRKLPVQVENGSDPGPSTKKRKTKGKNDNPSKATNPVTDQGSPPKLTIPTNFPEALTPATRASPISAVLSYIPPDETALNPLTPTPHNCYYSETNEKLPPSEGCTGKPVSQQSLDHQETSFHPSLQIPALTMTSQPSRGRRPPSSSRKRRTEKNEESRVLKRRRKRPPGQSKSVSPQQSGPSSAAVSAKPRMHLPRSTQNGVSESKAERSFASPRIRSPSASEQDINELFVTGGGKMFSSSEAMDKTKSIEGHVKCRLRVREGVRLSLRIRPKRETKEGLQVKLRLRTPSADRIMEGGVKDEIHEKQEQILVGGTHDNIEGRDYDEESPEVKGICVGEERGNGEGKKVQATGTFETKEPDEADNEGKESTDGVHVKLRLRGENNVELDRKLELEREKLHLKLRIREPRDVKEQMELEGGMIKMEEEEVELKDSESGQGPVMGMAAGRPTRTRRVTWKLQERGD